jgi:outer membrane protein OmpA-like peptidoglycan-associated protein
MVSWVAVLIERDHIEQDLTRRAKQALADEDSAWAHVVFNGRDANLSGRAVLESQPVKAEETVRKVWGVRDVDNNAALPPKVEPFLWSARRRGNRVRLFGYVPNRATRQTIIGMTNAALPGLDVVDRMSTARGVPHVDTWLAGLSFALKQLALLKRGDVRLEDLALTIAGEAEDAEAYRALNAALKPGNLPKGISLAGSQITAPVASPFVWSVQFAGGQVILSGHVPTDAHAELLAAANAGPPGTTVIDRMEFAEGAPQGWSTAAVAVVKDLMRLQSGEAEVRDTAVMASGIATDEASAQSVRAALRASIPPTFKLTHQITVRPPAPPPAPKVEKPMTDPTAQTDVRTATPPDSASLAQPRPAPQGPEKANDLDGKSEAATKSEAAAKTAVPPPPASAPTLPLKIDEGPRPTPPDTPPAAGDPESPPTDNPKAAMVVPPAPQQPENVQPGPSAGEPAPVMAPPVATSTPTVEPPPKIAVVAPPEPASEDVCGRDLAKVDTSGHILFRTNSARVDPASYDLLDRLAAAAQSCNGLRIAVEGHTDTTGSARYNNRLSVRRARAVQSYLVKAGMKAAQLEAIGYGFTRPAAPNDTAENMAKNRRIEFVIRRH